MKNIDTLLKMEVILVGGPLIIVISCVIFLLPFLDVIECL